MSLVGKYLDDIDWEIEIRSYIDHTKKSTLSEFRCENVGCLEYRSNDLQIRKKYVIEEASYKECIIAASNYYKWLVISKLSNNSTHMKKLFKLIFYPKPIHNQVFFIDESDVYDYEYMNYICDNIDSSANDLLSKCL